MAVLKVPVTKAGTTLDIDTDSIPDALIAAIWTAGLKHYINLKMSKISVAGLEGDKLTEARAVALEVAEKNKSDLLAGKTRVVGQKAEKGASGAVMTEARRLARNIVKDAMKREGIKVSYVDASEITKAANALIASTPEILATAKANLAEREQTKIAIDVTAIPISAKKEAAANAKKKDKPLSAKQAGKVTKHKPAAQATA